MSFITSARVARSARAASYITFLAHPLKTKVVVKAALFEINSATSRHEVGGVVTVGIILYV